MVYSSQMQEKCQVLVQELQALMIKHQWTLSVAESCTGGYLSSCLTAYPNASHYFQGGVISYSNEVKKNLLKVKEQTLQQFGAVSAEVVVEMTEGLSHLILSNYCLAISGIAGPGGGTPEKPVGTIWAAIKQSDQEVRVFEMRLKGGRREIMMKATETLLHELLKLIKTRESVMQ